MFEELKKEVQYRTSRSSGPGGQHVNKVSSKVELIFDIMSSTVLTDEQKQAMYSNLHNRISNDGLLLLQCEESSSQHQNKETVYKRFIRLIEKALKPIKKRKPTKPTRSSVQKRLTDKKKHSEKKGFRKNTKD